jgi:hypothetical protein
MQTTKTRLSGFARHVDPFQQHQHHKPMTDDFKEDLSDILPGELVDPWPPSDEEIEMMEWLQWLDDQQQSIPDAAERNRGLR